MIAKPPELKPCPFCGSAPQIYPLIPRGNTLTEICCINCDFSIMSYDERGDHKNKAIDTWNTRPDPAPVCDGKVGAITRLRKHEFMSDGGFGLGRSSLDIGKDVETPITAASRQPEMVSMAEFVETLDHTFVGHDDALEVAEQLIKKYPNGLILTEDK